MGKNKKVLYLFCIVNLSLCFFNLKSQDVFIPNTKIDTEYFPPFTSNLLKEEKDIQENKELKDIHKIFNQTVKPTNKQIEEQVNKIVQDKNKLDQLTSILSGQNKNQEISQDQSLLQNITPDIQNLIEINYKDPKLKQKISLKIKNCDIKEAIELIAKSTELNFIIDQSVTGVINNLNFEDVQAGIVLNNILNNNNPKLALIKKNSIFQISKLQDALPILKAQQEELQKKDFVSDHITIFNSKFSDIFKQRLEKMWSSIIANNLNKENHYLVIDENSKKIFFRGKKNEVKDFKNFLKETDIFIPQVRIEARVIIASKDFEESFGLQSSGVYNRRTSVNNGWNFIGFGPVKSPNGGGDFKPGNIMDWALNLLPTTASKYLNLPFVFGGKDLDNRRLNLVLNAAENRSEIRTILKPSLLVNSEEVSEILIGEEVPIETNVQERIDGTLRSMDTINYKSIGMKLKVKPVVSPDQQSVFLDIFVENSYVKTSGIHETFDSKKSIIATTKSRNKVLLKSGQTTLIGGLITNDKRKEKNGVPYLQEIPILGFLFSGTKRTQHDEQLMIFISPTIA